MLVIFILLLTFLLFLISVSSNASVGLRDNNFGVSTVVESFNELSSSPGYVVIVLNHDICNTAAHIANYIANGYAVGICLPVVNETDYSVMYNYALVAEDTYSVTMSTFMYSNCSGAATFSNITNYTTSCSDYGNGIYSYGYFTTSLTAWETLPALGYVELSYYTNSSCFNSSQPGQFEWIDSGVCSPIGSSIVCYANGSFANLAYETSNCTGSYTSTTLSPQMCYSSSGNESLASNLSNLCAGSPHGTYDFTEGYVVTVKNSDSCGDMNTHTSNMMVSGMATGICFPVINDTFSGSVIYTQYTSSSGAVSLVVFEYSTAECTGVTTSSTVFYYNGLCALYGGIYYYSYFTTSLSPWDALPGLSYVELAYYSALSCSPGAIPSQFTWVASGYCVSGFEFFCSTNDSITVKAFTDLTCTAYTSTSVVNSQYCSISRDVITTDPSTESYSSICAGISQPSDDDSGGSKSLLTSSAKTGIIVGCSVFVCFLIGGCLYLYFTREPTELKRPLLKGSFRSDDSL